MDDQPWYKPWFQWDQFDYGVFWVAAAPAVACIVLGLLIVTGVVG